MTKYDLEYLEYLKEHNNLGKLLDFKVRGKIYLCSALLVSIIVWMTYDFMAAVAAFLSASFLAFLASVIIQNHNDSRLRDYENGADKLLFCSIAFFALMCGGLWIMSFGHVDLSELKDIAAFLCPLGVVCGAIVVEVRIKTIPDKSELFRDYFSVMVAALFYPYLTVFAHWLPKQSFYSGDSAFFWCMLEFACVTIVPLGLPIILYIIEWDTILGERK